LRNNRFGRAEVALRAAEAGGLVGVGVVPAAGAGDGCGVASVAVVALSAGEDLVLGRAVVPGGTGAGVGFEAGGVALFAVGAVKASGNVVFASVGLVVASGAGRGVGRTCGTVMAYRA